MPKVFISYSHEDEPWKDKLLPHLQALELAGMGMVVWQDRQIDAGEKWHPAIQDAIADAVAALGGEDGPISYLPHGLLTRAWLRFIEGDTEGAKADLDEAWQIAERGAMKLHMADIHLHRARLFRDRAALDAPARLIEETGYHRRDDDLADAREALGSPPE